MLEKILEYERPLFLLLNSAHSPFGDQFMWLFSGFIAWIPVALLFFIILFYANRTRWKEVLLIVAAIVLTILLCDQFSSGWCKPFFARYRPTRHPDFMGVVLTVFDYKAGTYGFISSHAANGFGFATVTSLIFRNKFYAVVLFLWATVSAYSRIYLGVHFISDIIPGIVTGIFFGWIVYQIFVLAHKKTVGGIQQETPYPRNGLTFIISALLATVALLVFLSSLYAFQLIPAIQIK